MFWECHIVTSSIDKILDRPADEQKLQDFLDESDLIQECLNQNDRLLSYLVQSSVMQELIGQIITLPKNDSFRNANIVSELLSGDCQRIEEKLIEKENLDLLYSFLTVNNERLNPILASYFSRIINTLIIRKPAEIINYFKSKDTFKENFLNHLDSTSITDILFRLISDSSDQRSNSIQWYEDMNLIDGLVEQLVKTELQSVQINLVNLLSEFLRLAFDQQIGGMDSDIMGSSLTSTIERLLYSRNLMNQGSPLISHDDEKQSTNTDSENRFTPLVLAQHILSKSNLEQVFDAITSRPILVENGCDYLNNILDLLSRHMAAPVCISLTTKDDIERMQINDEGGDVIPPVNKSKENVANLAKDSLTSIYSTLIQIIPSRLPALIALLSSSCPPLIPPSNDNSQTVKYQFISEPLGSIRLNLIKFFSKLIYTISNDYTGDNIYQILHSNRFFPTLIDLFLRHVYNNFLHTQVYLIIRLVIHINSIAVKQPNDIWTRAPMAEQDQTEFSSASPFHYTNRCSYKLFQSLFNSSEVNLFERLLDEHEVNNATSKSTTTTSTTSEDTLTSAVLPTRFASPNSGHIAQILRCLRDHASTFDNYISFFKSKEQEKIDEDTNFLQIRWQTALDYLSEEEKKWSAMHHTERAGSNSNITAGLHQLSSLFYESNSNDYSETDKRRQAHQNNIYGNSGRPSVEDEDEDDEEVERFDIDDELMKNEQTTNERKVAEMTKIPFEPQFPAAFNEQALWFEQDESDPTKKINSDQEDIDKMATAPTLPDLFEHHRNQQEKNVASNESNFEQLCTLRTNDNGSGSALFPFQSSSTIRDEIVTKNDAFWKNHPIYLVDSHANQYSEQSRVEIEISSSDEDDNHIDIDEDEQSKIDSNIPDDENFFVQSAVETKSDVSTNNIMDVFRRQPSLTNDDNNRSNEDDNLERIIPKTHQEPISSSTPEREIRPQDAFGSPTDENNTRKRLTLDETNSDDDDQTLQDNFSFLIAKGMLKPS